MRYSSHRSLHPPLSGRRVPKLPDYNDINESSVYIYTIQFSKDKGGPSSLDLLDSHTSWRSYNDKYRALQ